MDPRTLLEPARLAATNPADHPTGVEVGALRWGLRAARLGAAVPVFVLLDAFALTRSPTTRPAVPGRGRSAGRWAEEYDAWLAKFVAAAARRFPHPPTRLGGEPGERDYLPLLLGELPPTPTADSAALARCYADLCESRAGAAFLRRAWAEPRPGDAATWRRHWADVDHIPRPAAGLLACFATARPDLPTAEKADHDALRLFLTADDLQPTPQQTQRFRNLLHVVQDPTRRPDNEARFTPHPTVGAFPLGRMVWEMERVQSDLVNNRGPRLTDDPHSLPPHRVAIHLAFVVGPRALARPDPRPGRGAAPAPASVLQAVAGLMLDDWRHALRDLVRPDGMGWTGPLRVHFHTHRPWPPAPPARLGHPGRRWRPREAGDPLPPDPFAGLLFERIDWVQASADPFAWPQGEPEPGWWCGCALLEDLADLGFTPPPGATGPPWTAPDPARLPPELRDIIVVDPDRGGGWVCRVARDTHTCRIDGPRAARGAGYDDWIYFGGLRRQALDAMLDSLARTHAPARAR